jgi:hypothetical protein
LPTIVLTGRSHAGAPTSTSDTICVELVRKLELTGCEAVEIGVRHYARLYGKSQFFRLKSLAATLHELARLWFRVSVAEKKGYQNGGEVAPCQARRLE